MADFDVDRLLNLERRTGIKETDIDEFLRKATDIEAAVKGLREGTVDPDKIKIEGIETEEEKKKKEAELEEKRRQYREKEEKLRLQRKQEEKERWWSGVEIFRPSSSSNNSENKRPLDANSKERLLTRYTADYSKWESWTPDDAVSIQEQKEREAEEEKKRNEEFEKNNPEFCQSFVNDMKERKKASEKKQETSEVLRLKGNKCFKNKDFEQALIHYMEALKNTPFDAKLLLNIAQSYIKLKNYEDADEFLNRTLYLEDKNVKALSRKAFVLSEFSNFSEALVVINKAITLDADNVELQTQQKEIAIMEKEEQLEKRLQHLLSNPTAEGASSALTGKNDITQLLSLITPFITSSKDDVDKNSSLLQHLGDSLPQILSLLLSLHQHFIKEPLLTILFRQQEGVTSLFQLIKVLFSLSSSWDHLKGTSNEKSQNDLVSYEAVMSASLRLINDLLDEKRASKHLFVEAKIYSFYKDLLTHSMTEAALPVQVEVVKAFYLLVKDEIYVKAKTLVFSDIKVWLLLAQSLGNVMNNALTGIYPSLLSFSLPVYESIHSIVQTVAKIFKEFFFSPNEQDKAAVKAIDNVTTMNIIFSFGVVLHFLSTSDVLGGASKEVMKRMRASSVEGVIGSLVGFSQHDHLKRHFVSPLPIPTKEEKSTKKTTSSSEEVTVISLLTDLIHEFSQFSVNGIAILMNSSIDITATSLIAKDLTSQQIKENNNVSAKVKQIIATSKHGLSLALSVLSMNDVELNPLLKIALRQNIHEGKNSSAIEEIDGIYYTRKVGLLSRVITVPSVTEGIIASLTPGKSPSPSYHYDHLYQLCLNIAKLVRPNHQDNTVSMTKEKEQQITNTPKWITDVLLHYIRILAHLFSSQAKVIFTNENMKKVLFDTQLLGALLYILPMPRMECGEITEMSVTQIPKFPQSSILVGNVVHVLLQFVNQSQNITFSKILFETESYYTIEKAICAMATCQDIRVRKNIAILLAKGCQLDVKIREKITKYRGMQMMLELQKEL